MRLRWRPRWWLVLPLLAVAYLLLVLGASHWLGGERVDLTRDHLYTLSPVTRTVRPVFICPAVCCGTPKLT